MFGGEAHDSIVRGGGVPDRSSDAVAAREGLVACVFFASDGRGPLTFQLSRKYSAPRHRRDSRTLDAAGRRRRARPSALCGAAARPRPRAAPTCRRARTAPKLFRAPPRRRPRRGRGRGRSSLVWLFAPRARPPRARAGPGPVFCCFVLCLWRGGPVDGALLLLNLSVLSRGGGVGPATSRRRCGPSQTPSTRSQDSTPSTRRLTVLKFTPSTRRRPDDAIEQTSTRRRPDDAIEQTRPREGTTRRGKADLERRAFSGLLGAVDADLDGLAERGPDLQVHPRQRGRLERRRGVAEERGQPVQRDCFGDCSSACGVDFCVDYGFDFSSGDCCHGTRKSRLQHSLRFLPLSPRDGARFAAGFARCDCGLRSWVFACFGWEGRELTRAARRQIGKLPLNHPFRGLQINDLDSLPPCKTGVLTKK